MRNMEIRQAALAAGVRMWEIAEGMGISDATLYRRLRREFSPDERDRALAVIERLSTVRSKAGGDPACPS